MDRPVSRRATSAVTRGAIETAERRVLRRRRGYLADTLDVDGRFQLALEKAELIDTSQRQLLDSERTSQARTLKLVDIVCSTPADGAFDTFCLVLAERGYKWVANNLEADLRIERGVVQVDEAIAQEAGMLVHRKFGASKRFSEGEKREIQELLAIKLQVTRDEMSRELDKLETQMKADREEYSSKDRQTRSLAATLRDFVKRNENRLTTHAHGMTTTSEALQLCVEEGNQDLVTKLSDNLSRVIKRLEIVLAHRENLIDERGRCARILGVSETSSSDLAEILASRLHGNGKADCNSSGKKASNDVVVMEKDHLIRRLNNKIGKLEDEIDELEDKLRERIYVDQGLEARNGEAIAKSLTQFPEENGPSPRKTKAKKKVNRVPKSESR